MPKRKDIKKILIIGSGPIVIGQACEFDYSGAQACKALRAEGYEVVLVNSNPATIMTDPELAHRTYIEPLTKEYLEEIISRERPQAILPTVGGQTALNLAVELSESGILEKYKVEMIARSDAPIISTLYFSRIPLSDNSTARFSAVCPPTVGKIACGRSRAIISSRYSFVSGSMYVRCASSGSVMIVAGFEFTSTTSYPSARSALHACAPE